MSAPRSLPVGLKPYLGTVTGKRVFGVRRLVNGVYTSPHNGCDFAVPVGIPLESGITGTVALAGGSMSHQWGYFLHVICTCPQRHTQEFHILRDKPTLKAGDRVTAGQVIGHSGRSGSLGGISYAPHHHHGVTVNGKHYDPLSIGWPTISGGVSVPLDNTEEDMPLTKEDIGLLLNYPAYSGGPSLSQALKDLHNVDVADAVWSSEVRRGEDKISVIQELADTKTIVIRLEAQQSALTAAVGALALANGIDPETLTSAIAEKVDAALADNFAAIPDAVRANVKAAL